MCINLKEKNNNEGYNNDEILKIRGKVEQTSLLNILSLSEIYYDPDIRNTIVTEDSDMIEEYMMIRGEEIDNMRDNISPWLLRLVLNKDYLNINMETIEEIIKQKISIGEVLVIHSRETSYEKKIHIRLQCSDSDDEEKKKRLKSLEHLKVFESRLLSEVSLCGIESIKKVCVRNIKKVKYDDITGELIPSSKAPEESVLETDGTNLAKIFEVEEIDFRRTISNDINEILIFFIIGKLQGRLP